MTNIKSQIKQATELAETKNASFEKQLASLKNEIQKARKEAREAKTEIAGGTTQVFSNSLKGRKQFLQMRVEALEDACDESLSAKDKLIALRTEDLDAELRASYGKMRGLLSYVVATGQSTPDAKLLFDSLGDFLEAQTDGDRRAARRTVDLCLQHGNLGDSPRGEPDAGSEVLRRFESIDDPEQRSAFYAKHKAEIVAAHDRKNGLS